MSTFHIRVWVGPTMVHVLSRMFRRAGIHVTIEGTETIHAMVEAETADSAQTILVNQLQAKFGRTFGISPGDVRILCEEREEK
jgi:hypothetical protein